MSKGTYALVLKCTNNVKVSVGKLGNIEFKKGCYVYIGSAMNSLEKRIERHKKKKKKKHWHIDYLTSRENFEIVRIFSKVSEKKEECKLAEKIKETCDGFVKNFGCSDCNCKSHLFYFASEEKAFVVLKKIFAS